MAILYIRDDAKLYTINIKSCSTPEIKPRSSYKHIVTTTFLQFMMTLCSSEAISTTDAWVEIIGSLFRAHFELLPWLSEIYLHFLNGIIVSNTVEYMIGNETDCVV